MSSINTITGVVLTKNNEDKIEECLSSLSWVDKLIVVDTGSTDKTTSIVKKFKCEIFHHGNGGYSQWRNFALSKINTDWVLYVDSDERVSKDLEKEIKSIVHSNSGDCGCYVIPRLNNILGKYLKHGGWYPDYVKRLFRVRSLKKWTGDLHEEPLFDGELYKLNSNLLHVKEQTLSEMVAKTNKWSEIEAKLMFDANHPRMNVPRFLSAMFREFWYRFIKNLAFLDGGEGIIMGIYQVYSRFISYAKLWEMQIKDDRGYKTDLH